MLLDDAQKKPAGHVAGASEPAAQYVPSGHAEQPLNAIRPLTLELVPAGQSSWQQARGKLTPVRKVL